MRLVHPLSPPRKLVWLPTLSSWWLGMCHLLGQLVAMVINVHPCHGDCRQGQCWLLSTRFVEPMPLVLPGSVLLIAVREGCTCMQGHFLSKFPPLPKASPPSVPTSFSLPSFLSSLPFSLPPPSILSCSHLLFLCILHEGEETPPPLDQLPSVFHFLQLRGQAHQLSGILRRCFVTKLNIYWRDWCRRR